jgi:hypothetical protein
MLRHLTPTSKNNKYKSFYDDSNNHEYEGKSIEKYKHSNLFNV